MPPSWINHGSTKKMNIALLELLVERILSETKNTTKWSFPNSGVQMNHLWIFKINIPQKIVFRDSDSE